MTNHCSISLPFREEERFELGQTRLILTCVGLRLVNNLVPYPIYVTSGHVHRLGSWRGRDWNPKLLYPIPVWSPLGWTVPHLFRRPRTICPQPCSTRREVRVLQSTFKDLLPTNVQHRGLFGGTRGVLQRAPEVASVPRPSIVDIRLCKDWNDYSSCG